MKEMLWQPSAERIAQANMTKFMGFVNQKYGQELCTYDELYDWSVTEAPAFWESVWEFGGVNLHHFVVFRHHHSRHKG